MKTLEQNVMTNVAVIYLWRKCFGVTALKLYALALSAGGVVALVSITNVFANLVKVSEGGVGSIAFFLLSAVLGTTILVQAALVIGAFAAISLITPMFRGSRAFV